MSIIARNSTSGTSVSHDLGDASFSLYLNGGEETFVLKPADANQSQESSSTTHEPIHLGRKKAEDREIDVFTADKYFNEGANNGPITKELPNQQHKKKDPLQIFDIKEKARIQTRSIPSESSWNSRSALLLNIPRNQQPCRKSNKKSFLASIACNCSCNDKNSVEIDDYTGDNYFNKSVSSRVDNGKEKQELENSDTVPRKEDWQCKELDGIRAKLKTDDHFSFPVSNLKTGNPAVKTELQEAEDNSMRKSLEVFGSPILESGKNSSILEKRLTMLNWDTISPRVEEIEIPSSSNGIHNDSDSDTSSDLFEIESLSKNANPFLTRQASDCNSVSSCITHTTCYAPSEASIEWSVITASAADFSTMSDTEELRSTTATIAYPQKTVLNPPKWRRPSILSGCKSHTAVRVAGDAFPNARRHNQTESFTPVTRFHAESKMTGFNKRNSQNSFDSSSLSRSHSGRATHLLYIQ
ncbi:Protein PHYTOCHROME KINASE SUBSTRATE 1 [Forsythia ovata]|uniref:Protein PHYTOCHROME KINASE SUBSTRATE 1 n=1 Tax=Forsythia ovata TaxID=205694 RepID=A0ABD1WAR6_9LAMI